MTTPAPVTSTTVKDRLMILLDTLLDEGTLIPKTYHPIVRNLAKGFINKADPEQIEKQITQLRDDFIPWILTGQVPEK